MKKYTTEHEWVELSADDKIATIGITHERIKYFGEVVMLNSLDMEKVVAKDHIATIECTAGILDFATPVSGTVTEMNNMLEESPEKIQQSPEGDGWIAKIYLESGVKDEMKGMMSENEYKNYVKDQQV